MTKEETFMKITIVCDVLGEENNGTSVATMNLVRYLKSQGHEVRILCGDQNRKNHENTFVVPNKNFGKALNNYVASAGVSLAKPDEDVILKAIDGVDIVHIMIPLSLGIATAKIAYEKNIPITAGFHMQAQNLTSYIKVNKVGFINGFVYKYIWKHLYQYVDGIHFPTEFIKDEFEKAIHKQTPAYVISNGVNKEVKKKDVQKPKELEDKFIILSIGRFAREKSHDTLIKAINYSKHKNNIQLIFAGQGGKEKLYHKLDKKLPVKPIYKFFSRQEIIDVINYSDLYVHPAEVELEGIACLEAIACGKVTIVSDSKLSATKNFAISPKCVFKCRNPKKLATCIDYWIEHEDERKEAEKEYLKNSVIFNQDECMKKMEDMMKGIIHEKQKAKRA